MKKLFTQIMAAVFLIQSTAMAQSIQPNSGLVQRIQSLKVKSEAQIANAQKLTILKQKVYTLSKLTPEEFNFIKMNAPDLHSYMIRYFSIYEAPEATYFRAGNLNQFVEVADQSILKSTEEAGAYKVAYVRALQIYNTPESRALAQQEVANLKNQVRVAKIEKIAATSLLVVGAAVFALCALGAIIATGGVASSFLAMMSAGYGAIASAGGYYWGDKLTKKINEKSAVILHLEEVFGPEDSPLRMP